ncbi:MAG: hypothetical protein JO340_06895 [Acidobacteriaceae bacterium]|nr:hypothetical protein [Acidobacteriaceae bacterium]
MERCDLCARLERVRLESLTEYKAALNRQTDHLQKRIAAAYYTPYETDREIAVDVRRKADAYMNADGALSEHLGNHHS